MSGGGIRLSEEAAKKYFPLELIIEAANRNDEEALLILVKVLLRRLKRKGKKITPRRRHVEHPHLSLVPPRASAAT